MGTKQHSASRPVVEATEIETLSPSAGIDQSGVRPVAGTTSLAVDTLAVDTLAGPEELEDLTDFAVDLAVPPRTAPPPVPERESTRAIEALRHIA